MVLDYLEGEISSSVLRFLHGFDAMRSLSCSCSSLLRQLRAGSFWAACVRQEFRVSGCPPKHAAHQLYRTLRIRELCRTMRWARVPCRHDLGARGMQPAVFCIGRYLFVLGEGGLTSGEYDLHCGLLSMPLVLRKVSVAGKAPPATCKSAVTLLVDDAHQESEVASAEEGGRVIVTGGLHNGRASDCFGILSISITSFGSVSAEWCIVGQLLSPRIDHSATFVPGRIAGSSYPHGYVLLIGGRGMHTSGCMELLDLGKYECHNLSWAVSDPCIARCDHSATLMHDPLLGSSILLAGGNMNSTNKAALLFGLCGAQFEWKDLTSSFTASFESHKFGIVACRLAGTNSVLFPFGGQQHAAFVNGRLRSVEVLGASCPESRFYNGCCALPDGTVLIFGGIARDSERPFADIWVAHTGRKTSFFLEVQREQSFLTKMQRRVSDGRQIADSSEEEYPEVVQGSSGNVSALVDDLIADLDGTAEVSNGAAQPFVDSDDSDDG
eukprot:TRINITY_DN29636_c0_g1_i1.p1 TRINITY_DN29636_c0_g1~~TRINITY_DN29636_c0_g1_i1.p1  ORF type:complete len:496 (+),score=20.28 TRINITY_DN29636_c0_g1_i1:42-1529(+)